MSKINQRQWDDLFAWFVSNTETARRNRLTALGAVLLSAGEDEIVGHASSERNSAAKAELIKGSLARVSHDTGVGRAEPTTAKTPTLENFADPAPAHNGALDVRNAVGNGAHPVSGEVSFQAGCASEIVGQAQQSASASRVCGGAGVRLSGSGVSETADKNGASALPHSQEPRPPKYDGNLLPSMTAMVTGFVDRLAKFYSPCPQGKDCAGDQKHNRIFSCDHCSFIGCCSCMDRHEAEPHWSDSMTTAERYR